MRKLLLFSAILFVSVLSSACINNIAIQELNSKAQEYMQKGDLKNAIARLESSVDLDGSILETRYNLGVAYINAQEFENAQVQLQEAIKIKPDWADSYYSLAIAQEGEALKILDSKVEKPEVEVISKDSDSTGEELKDIGEQDAKKLVSKLQASIDSYNKYIELNPQGKDVQKVKEQINYLENLKNNYGIKYNLIAQADEATSENEYEENEEEDEE